MTLKGSRARQAARRTGGRRSGVRYYTHKVSTPARRDYTTAQRNTHLNHLQVQAQTAFHAGLESHSHTKGNQAKATLQLPPAQEEEESA